MRLCGKDEFCLWVLKFIPIPPIPTQRFSPDTDFRNGREREPYELPGSCRAHAQSFGFLSYPGALMQPKCWYVYILSSLRGTLYVGMSDDLPHRMSEHKHEWRDGFTKKHQINRLLYFEVFRDQKGAAAREKQIKKYRREKKIALFTPSNPHWKDLTEDIRGLFWRRLSKDQG